MPWAAAASSSAEPPGPLLTPRALREIHRAMGRNVGLSPIGLMLAMSALPGCGSDGGPSDGPTGGAAGHAAGGASGSGGSALLGGSPSAGSTSGGSGSGGEQPSALDPALPAPSHDCRTDATPRVCVSMRGTFNGQSFDESCTAESFFASTIGAPPRWTIACDVPMAGKYYLATDVLVQGQGLSTSIWSRAATRTAT